MSDPIVTALISGAVGLVTALSVALLVGWIAARKAKKERAQAVEDAAAEREAENERRRVEAARPLNPGSAEWVYEQLEKNRVDIAAVRTEQQLVNGFVMDAFREIVDQLPHDMKIRLSSRVAKGLADRNLLPTDWLPAA